MQELCDSLCFVCFFVWIISVKAPKIYHGNKQTLNIEFYTSFNSFDIKEVVLSDYITSITAAHRAVSVGYPHVHSGQTHCSEP